MRRTLVGSATAVVLALSSASLAAHHSFTAEFDQNKTITLRGIETGTPMQLIRQGGDRKTLAVGTEIVVDGWLARDGSRTVNGRAIKFGDGREILAGTSNAGAQ